MLSDILLSIDLSRKLKTILTDVQFNKLIGLFSAYKTDMWLYPGVIKRKIGLSTEETYEILHGMEKASLVEAYYELGCGNCQHSTGSIYKTINELPEYFQCELCHKELPSIENAVLIYKVIKG